MMEHNIRFESEAPEFVRARNGDFLKVYNQLIITIDRMQGFLDDKFLRIRIESSMKDKPGVQSTLYQCTTPWCIISLGCDTMGRYNLAYSIDHRIQQMVGETMASGLLRRIYQFTMGEMESFVRIGCLYADCIATFNELLLESEQENFHRVIRKEPND
jgi:hypothetical protein